MSKFHRYMVAYKADDIFTEPPPPRYYRWRWLAKLVAWYTGGKFIDTNDQVTL